MELIIFIVVVLSGLGIYFFYYGANRKTENERNYYYKRFMRNKLQLQRFIEQVQTLLGTYSCGNDLIYDGLTIKMYLQNLEEEYSSSYSNSLMKILKKNNLKHKDKKHYAKILVRQSEKLYHVEMDLIALQTKYENLTVL